MPMAPKKSEPSLSLLWPGEGARSSGPKPMARLFLGVLRQLSPTAAISSHEFVLMPEHFHLLFTPMPDVSLEKALQLIKGGFRFA